MVESAPLPVLPTTDAPEPVGLLEARLVLASVKMLAELVADPVVIFAPFPPSDTWPVGVGVGSGDGELELVVFCTTGAGVGA